MEVIVHEMRVEQGFAGRLSAGDTIDVRGGILEKIGDGTAEVLRRDETFLLFLEPFEFLADCPTGDYTVVSGPVGVFLQAGDGGPFLRLLDDSLMPERVELTELQNASGGVRPRATSDDQDQNSGCQGSSASWSMS